MLANNYGKYFLKTSRLYFSKIKLVKLDSNLISVKTKTTEIDATNFWLSLETISVNNLQWENLHYACSVAKWDQKISSVAFKFSYAGPIFLYDYAVILSTFELRLKFLNFCLHNKKF